MSELLEGLNSAQEKAVTYGQGPLCIIAGAGTGKTTVITRRIAHLILEHEVRPEQVLALTFTDKAAGEMEERIDALLPMGYVDLWVSTFHSFCERLLREHAFDVGLSSDFRLLPDTEQWLLLRQHIDELELEYYRPKGNPTKFVQALLSHFSRLKDEDVTPEEYMAYAEELQQGIEGGEVKKPNTSTQPKLAIAVFTEEEKEEAALEAGRVMEVARAYTAYQKLLRENNALDFGDVIVELIHLFKERPAVLKKYQEQFQYIVVDEFQDTNVAQYELIKLLAGERQNLTVVADDDQSIYSFRGASMSNILIFQRDFPKAAQVSLTENYRSRQGILDLAYNFIQHNNPNRLEATLHIDKKLTATREGDAVIEHLHSESLEGEAHRVMEKILELKKAEPDLLWSDIAVLVRANDHAQTFLPYFDRAQIPYHFMAVKGLFQKPLILDIINTLKVIIDYHESPSLYRVLNIPVWDIAHTDIMALLQLTSKKGTSLYQACKDVRVLVAEELLTSAGAEKIEKILALFDELALNARSKTVGEILLSFLDQSGYLQYITKHDAEHAEERASELNQFYQYVLSFERNSLEKSLKHFVYELSMMIDSGENGKLAANASGGDASPDAVKVMTVHGSKGLEFEYVFVVNLVDKRFPGIGRRDPIEVPEALIKDIIPAGNHHIEEERRLFYVAITRAKKGLYLTSGENYGGVRKKKPSQFLVECGFADTVPSPTGKVLWGPGEEDNVKAPIIPQSQASAELKRLLPRSFSFSQLEAYETCPWQYRFAFLLRVPIPGSGAASFGRSVHQTLYEFFKRGMERGQNPQGDLFSEVSTSVEIAADSNLEVLPPPLNMPGLDELLAIYDKEWIDEWYENEHRRNEYYEKGKEALKAFYELHVGVWPQVFQLEQVFTMPIAGEHKLKGAIDRIDISIAPQAVAPQETDTVPKQTGTPVSIVDYKTGKYNEKKDTKQLYIYAMALQEVFGYAPQTLSYYFIEENKTVDIQVEEKKMEKTREWVLSMIEKITEGNFTPKPGRHCSYCDFRDICEYRAK